MEIPIYEKVNLTIEETTALTHIGRDKIKELEKRSDCDFTLKVGAKTLIKREKFVNYIMNKSVIWNYMHP